MNSTKLFVCFLLSSFLFTTAVHADLRPVGAVFYVSPQGEDANDGSESAPFATLQRAQQAVRALVRKGLEQSVCVYLEGGVYALRTPLRFGPEDSGTESCAIYWRARPGARALISGGRALTNWQSAGPSKWSGELPEVRAGGWWFRQVFADGERLARARHPNGDGAFVRVKELDAEIKNFTLDAPIPGGINPSHRAEMVVIQNWAVSRADLTAIDNARVSTRQPVGFIGHSNALITSKEKPVFFEHHLAWLDAPGEWVLDGERGLLTMQMNESPATMEVIAPYAQKLIVIEGRPRQPVRNLKFENLAFAHTRWDMPEEGYMGIQAGHYGPRTDAPYRLLPGAIEWRYAVECGLRNCEIAHTGANGVVLGAGCQRNVIERCKFNDIGGNGVMVGWREGEPDARRVPSDNSGLAADWQFPSDAPAANQVLDNHLTRCGQQFWGCVAIFDAFALHTHIAYNHVEAMPYTGISTGYRWDRDPSNQRGGIIEYNHIHSVMRRIADGGGIYTLGWQPNAVLRGNHIHDVQRSVYAHGGAPNNGIFFDQGSSGFRVEQNVIYDIAANPVRFNQCEADWQTWIDNVFRTLPKDAGFPTDWLDRAGPRFAVGIQ